MKYHAFMLSCLWKQLWWCKIMTLTFLQDNLYHDTVSGFGRLTPAAQRVAAVVVQVAIVSHVGSDPSHSRGGAEGVRPAQLSYLYRTTQSAHTQAGPHHQSQQALFNLLPENTTWYFPIQCKAGNNGLLLKMTSAICKNKNCLCCS